MSDESPRQYISVIVVAVLILIQGIVYLGLSLLPIFIHNDCHTTQINLGRILFLDYFKGDECSLIQSSTGRQISNTFSDDSLKFDFNDEKVKSSSIRSEAYKILLLPDHINVAHRTYILIIIYSTVSAVWILTSCLALVGSFCTVKSKNAYNICFTPWFLIVIFGSVLDLVATGFFAYDIIQTRTLRNTLKYIGVKNLSDALNYDNYSRDYVYLPIVLVCLSSRLVIFWILNTFGIFLAIKQTRKISQRKDSGLNHQNEEINGEPCKYQDDNNYKQNTNQSELSPSHKNHRRYERRTFEPLKSGDMDSQLIKELQQNSALKNQRLDELRRYHDTSTQTYTNYQEYDRNENTPTPEPSITYRLSHSPATSNRYSSSSKGRNSEIIPPKDKVHITEELRGQLPWSYFNVTKDITKPKHGLLHSDDHEVMPPVPVPDYTYHFPRKERPSIKSDMMHNNTTQYN